MATAVKSSSTNKITAGCYSSSESLRLYKYCVTEQFTKFHLRDSVLKL